MAPVRPGRRTSAWPAVVGWAFLFKKGKVVKKFPEDRLVEVVLAAVEEFEQQTKSH